MTDDELKQRQTMLRYEARGCMEKAADWRSSSSHSAETITRNADTLLLCALTLEGRAWGLELMLREMAETQS